MTALTGLRVGIVGCGLIGRKRALALDPSSRLVGCVDLDVDAARRLGHEVGAEPMSELEALLALRPDVVVAAVTHDDLTDVAVRALAAGAHVLVEKPAGLGVRDVQRVATSAQSADRLVKVGFNHRFHPGVSRAVSEARSGRYGEIMHVRARYGHGGRVGYDREWRSDPARSGGGELIDQGMHIIDLCHWLLGPLPLHSALLRTQFWDTPAEDNAVVILGERDDRQGPWALLHVTWTEWKNLFSLEVYCRSAKIQVDGLARSYGPQRLRIYRMKPDLGPPDLEEISYPAQDVSWEEEWKHFADAIGRHASQPNLSGNLDDALYAWGRVEEAYTVAGYANMRLEATG